ncbi:MAG: signal peptidase I [Pseudomonadota bacterium]|nr:signal peptidase I [Pseudomonadota bacterium]
MPPDKTTEPNKPERKPKKSKPAFFSIENLRSLAIWIVIIFAIRWSVASPYHVPTPSMEPTIKVGDRLLAYKLSYEFKLPFTDIALFGWDKPTHGDIIVFRYPNDPNIDYVKRVVAIGGDDVELRNGYLYINANKRELHDHNFDRSILADIYDNKDDKLLYREGSEQAGYWVMYNKTTQFATRNWPWRGTFKVPQDSVVVIGDNRDNSSDSREWREVPLSYVRGKALFVLWSMFTPQGDPWYRMQFRLNRFGYTLR